MSDEFKGVETEIASSEEVEVVNYSQPVIEGIGGWLIFIVISFVYSIFKSMSAIAEMSSFKTDEYTMELFSNSSEYYDKTLVNFINFNIGFHFISIVIIIVALVLMFSKKRLFPMVAIGEMIFNMAAILIMIILYGKLGDIAGDLTITLIVGIFFSGLMIAYYLNSERVKNTFIN